MFTDFEKGTKPVRWKPLLSLCPSKSKGKTWPLCWLGVWVLNISFNNTWHTTYCTPLFHHSSAALNVPAWRCGCPQLWGAAFRAAWPWAVKPRHHQSAALSSSPSGCCLLSILGLIWLSVQFKPLEQLMGVFPAASGNFLPDTWRNLMSSPVSVEDRITSACACTSVWLITSAVGLIHHWLLPGGLCYRSQWKEVRVAGWAWKVQISCSAWNASYFQRSWCVCVVFDLLQSVMFYLEGVALLPFVDERRLRAALADVYPDLTPEEGEKTKLNQASSITVSLKEQTFIHAWIHELVRVINWHKSDKTDEIAGRLLVSCLVTGLQLQEAATRGSCIWQRSLARDVAASTSGNFPETPLRIILPECPQMYHFSADDLICVDFYFMGSFSFGLLFPQFHESHL